MRAILLLAASTLLMRHAAEPLSVQFLPPEHGSTTHELGYSLSDRAYVAVFVILPGRGVAVLYPFNPTTKPEEPGDHFLPLQGAGTRHEQRLAALLIAERQEVEGSYLLLVASRQPLRLDPYVTRPEALDSAIGPAVRRGMSMDAVVTGLVKQVTNVTNEGDFAYDLDQTSALIPPRR